MLNQRPYNVAKQSNQIVHSNGRLTKTSKKEVQQKFRTATRYTSHHFVMNLALLPNGYDHIYKTAMQGQLWSKLLET